MTEADIKHVSLAIRTLCAVHRVRFDKLLRDGYWEGLKDMSRPAFDAALVELRKSKWMPKPHDFWEYNQRGWI